MLLLVEGYKQSLLEQALGVLEFVAFQCVSRQDICLILKGQKSKKYPTNSRCYPNLKSLLDVYLRELRVLNILRSQLEYNESTSRGEAAIVIDFIIIIIIIVFVVHVKLNIAY